MGNNNKFNIVKYFEDIKRQLYSLGYENKLVSVKEVEDLYNIYGYGFSLNTFLREVLEIETSWFIQARASDKSVTILKIKDRLTDKEIIELSNRLIKLGYAMNKVNYFELEKIYNKFGKNLTLRTFATRVLNLSFGSYEQMLKHRDKKFIILKNVGNIENIKRIMLDDGYENYIISSYSNFLDLYSTYGYTFTETIFATEVLGMSYNQYRVLKRTKNNYNVKVLTRSLTLEEISEIIDILKKQGYENKKISYNDFLALYNIYGENTNIKEFSITVLNMSLDDFKTLKYNRGSVIISFKDTNKKYNAIIEKMVQDRLLNKSITYKELQQLHFKYAKELTEKEFALEVLGISLDNYRACKKTNNPTRVIILKKNIEKEITKIKEILISKGYTNKKISYQEFLNLYKQYGYFLSDRKFANEVLGVNYSTYDASKTLKRDIIVLPLKNKPIKELQDIKKALIEYGYENKEIDVEQIDILYECFGHGITKTDFINKVLGVNLEKDQKKKVILKKIDILNEDEMEDLKQKIYSLGYYHKDILASEVIELYNKYGTELSFKTFRNRILNITAPQLNFAKKYNLFIRINDINVDNTMEYIRNVYLNDYRYYSKEEIIMLCNYYNISFDDFIYYVYLKKYKKLHEKYFNRYKEILVKHGKLWIGNGIVDMNMLQKYYDKISKSIRQAITHLKNEKYYLYKNQSEYNDVFQDALLFFMENGSEIQNNYMVYEDDYNWESYLQGKIKKHLMYKYYAKVRKYIPYASRYYNKYSDEEREFVDENTDTAINAIDNLQIDNLKRVDECITSLGNLILEGYSIKESKELICKKMNIDEITLKEIMEIYIEEHNIINFDISVLEFGGDTENNRNYQKVKVK